MLYHHHHHFLIVAYPAQSHINPSLHFAKRLISLGARVTFSTTLHAHRRMTAKPVIPGLSFLPFSDGYDDGFTASDNSLYASELKRRGSEFVTNLLLSTAKEDRHFTCLVYTPLLHWTAQVARGFHLPTALLWIQPSTVFNIFYYYFHGFGDYIDEKVKEAEAAEPSCSIELPGLPSSLQLRDLPSHIMASHSFYSTFVQLFEEQFHEIDQETNPRVLVNTFEALEPEALMAVDELNVIPIGPLIPSAFLDGKDPTDTSIGGDIFDRSTGCIEWLDSKPRMSVIYVSFGSFCVLSKRQMEEIARALLDCGRPFLWVIREKEKKKGEKEEEEELSCREELEKNGKIVKWCSQMEVLSHPSLGCFLTHCGWNSTVESLVSGVSMVAFPQWADQKTNAKLIEDVWKTGVRVDHRVNEDGLVEGEEIRRCLEVVMGGGKKGEELRRNAEKWRGLAREAVEDGGSSEKNLRAFLDDAVGQQRMHLGVNRVGLL